MDELTRNAHKVSKIRSHVVFCIKYRKDFFLEETYIQSIKQICKEIEEKVYIKFETTGFDDAHVHFLIESLTTDYSPVKISQFVKSIIARELFKRHPQIKKKLRGGEFWSDGGLTWNSW